MENSLGARDRRRLSRLRRFQWITLALFLPLVALAAPLYLGFPLTHGQMLALRTAFAVWSIVVDIAVLIGLTFAVHLNWTEFRPRWGGRMMLLSAYGVLVPFFYLPLAYLTVGSIGNLGIDVAFVGVPLVASFALIGFGLLVTLVELGLKRAVS